MKKDEIVRSKLFPDLPTKFHFFSIAEVAIILGTSTKLVHEWVTLGILRSFRLGPKSRLIRVSYQDLENFIDSHIKSGEIIIKKDEPASNSGEQSETCL